MSDSTAWGFGQWIPGFDFLHHLGQPGSAPSGLPPFAQWAAPTLSVEEISKRIDELKTVQFWLEQNSKALAATVQALEVQRMTLSTLRSMNVDLETLSQAFVASQGAAAQPQGTDFSSWPMPGGGAGASSPNTSAASSKNEPEPAAVAMAQQWWNGLTQQFQHIAQQAAQHPAQQEALLRASQMGAEWMRTAAQAVQPAQPPASGSTAPAASKPKKKAPSSPNAASTDTQRAPRGAKKTRAA